MLHNCRKSCGSCEQGNYTSWKFDGDESTAGALHLGDECLDTAGQLPPAHGGTPNALHTTACDASRPGQKWLFNATGGMIVSAPQVSEATEPRACLRATATWLWPQPVVNLNPGCDPGTPPRTDATWHLHANGTLENVAHGCVALSTTSGPPSTIWSKPLSNGRVALLAINAADVTQRITLDFDDLLESSHAVAWQVRDIWAQKNVGALSTLTRDVPPHDCVLVVLTPMATMGDPLSA